MHPKIKAIVLLILLILVESFALYCVKKSSVKNTKNPYIIYSIILYAFIPVILYFALKNNEGLAITNLVWNIASTIYGIFIGIILFNEVITNEQKIGALMGFLGLVLMI